MPKIEIVVGERSFEVACQPGEEPSLRAAAEILNREAAPLATQMGPMPGERMLLMAGLMLADRLAGSEERLREVEARLRDLEAREPEPPREVEVRVEVPVVPPEVSQVIADLAAEAEALALAVLAVAPERTRRLDG